MEDREDRVTQLENDIQKLDREIDRRTPQLNDTMRILFDMLLDDKRRERNILLKDIAEEVAPSYDPEEYPH